MGEHDGGGLPAASPLARDPETELVSFGWMASPTGLVQRQWASCNPTGPA